MKNKYVVAAGRWLVIAWFISAALNAVAQTALPSPILASVANRTLTVGQNLSSDFSISSYAYNPAVSDDYKAWTITATGLPSNMVLYSGVLMSTFFEVGISGFSSVAGVYPVTVTAVNNRAPNDPPYITRFTITVVDKTSPNATLTLLAPTINCSTGGIVFNTSGGDGTTITYGVPGITRANLTDNFGTVEPGLLRDPKVIPIKATQSGYTATYDFDLKAACQGVPTSQPPRLLQSIPDQTFTVGQPIPPINLGSYFYDPNGYPHYRSLWSFSRLLPDGLALTSTDETSSTPAVYLIGTPTRAGTYTATFTATLLSAGNLSTTATFKITVLPATGNNALTLTAPTYNCATGAITFNTTGGDGSPIEYAAAGITGWSTNPNQFVDRESRTANDVKPFTLLARQNGQIVTYTWDLKAACGRARQGVAEAAPDLNVMVLGNPAGETATVEITGAGGLPLHLRLVDSRGRLVEQRSVEQAGITEQQTFDLHHQPPGLLLLHTTTTGQSRTVKVLKQ